MRWPDGFPCSILNQIILCGIGRPVVDDQDLVPIGCFLVRGWKSRINVFAVTGILLNLVQITAEPTRRSRIDLAEVYLGKKIRPVTGTQMDLMSDPARPVE